MRMTHVGTPAEMSVGCVDGGSGGGAGVYEFVDGSVADVRYLQEKEVTGERYMANDVWLAVQSGHQAAWFQVEQTELQQHEERSEAKLISVNTT
jgi:hypothetical protein